MVFFDEQGVYTATCSKVCNLFILRELFMSAHVYTMADIQVVYTACLETWECNIASKHYIPVHYGGKVYEKLQVL